MNQITINGTSYPLELTVGAVIEFNKITGKEIEQANGVSDIGALLYAAAKSTSRASKIPFALDFEEFCDNLSLEDLNLINEIMPAAKEPEKEQKKRGSK